MEMAVGGMRGDRAGFLIFPTVSTHSGARGNADSQLLPQPPETWRTGPQKPAGSLALDECEARGDAAGLAWGAPEKNL